MPIQRWRCPIALQAKSAVFAAAGAAVAKVFFPLWFAVPVMAVLGVWVLGMCVRRGEAVVDPGAGLLVVRFGPITRRIRLASITAVQVDRAKVSVARSDGGDISVYAWRRSRLDGWLRVPVVADDLAHAVSRAAAAAPGPGAAARPRPARTPAWSRRRLGPALVGCAGLAALGAAFAVRLSWAEPVMTALGAALALALGVSGVFYLVSSVWLLLRARAAREPG